VEPKETADRGDRYFFAGDTSQLQGIIKNRLIDFYDSKWSIEAVIDQLSKYDLSLRYWDASQLQDPEKNATKLRDPEKKRNRAARY
jgi:hypothetical protein